MLRAKPTAVSLPRGVITAMFTDIVESTQIKSLMEGETSARRDSLFRRQIKEPHDAVILTCVREADGYLVNPTGDGFCTTFVDAEEAVCVRCEFSVISRKNPIETPLGPLRIRIGLHTGIAGPTGDDYIASTIDKTARVQSQAAPGQVFVSHQTQVLVSDKTQNVHFEARGIFDLKGLQSEELYQAMPQLDLYLPTVSPDPAALRLLDKGRTAAPGLQNSGAAGQSNGILPRSLLPIGLALLLVAGALWWAARQRNSPVSPSTSVLAPVSVSPSTAGSASTSPASSSPASSSPASTSQILASGSHWSGNFHFLPPTPRYDGSVSIEVTQRSGDTFAGLYSSENDAYRWLIEGTVKGQKLHWNFVKAVKNPGKEDAVGKAFGEGTVNGDQIKGFFRTADNKDEVAALDLRRDK